MGKKRDRFWEHAEDLDGKFKCNFCGRIFSGGVPRVKSHLSGIKCRGIDKCTRVPDHVRVAVAEAISHPKKRVKAEACSSKTEETLPKILISKEGVMLDKLLAKFIVLNDIDADIVQKSSFINLWNGMAKHGSHYNIPHYSVVKAKLVPDLEKEIGEYVAKVKKSWETTGCTIMSDVWRDEERCFVNIFAHSIEGMVLLNALDVHKDVLTGTLLQEFICFVSEEIGANNIVQYITKDAEKEGLNEDISIGNYRHMYGTKCVAHEVHLLFEKIYNESECVRKVFDVVTKIHNHGDILSSMKQFTDNWEWKQSSTNSFYSNYYKLRSIMGAESEMRLDFEKDESGVELGGIIRNSEFWSEGKEVLRALKSIFQVLHLVDSYSATSGYLYAYVKMADEAIKKIYDADLRKYQELWETFNTWQKKVINPIHAAAAFLNPAYMCSEKFVLDPAMKKGMNIVLSKLVGSEERVKFTEEMKLYRTKGSELFTCTAITMLQTSHPCDWWEFCDDVVPVLKKYAIRILSQPCSTSSRRRGLTAFETAQIEKRRPLVPAVMDTYLYLRTNALLMENFNEMKEKIGKPLDLEKLDELPDSTEFIYGNFTSDLLNETKVRSSDGKLNCWSASARKDGEREKHLLLHFITKLPSSLVKGNEVKGEKGDSIHVILVDSNTGSVVRSGPPSVLELAVTVIRGGFAEEAGKYWTREFFERNEIMGREETMPLLNGVLPIILDKGMGTLGAITFNDVSSWTKSGTFRLGVKTALGFCEGIRVLEGTSNAFKVEDVNRADPSICGDRIWTLNNAPVDAADAISLASSSKEFVGSLLGTSLVEPLTLSLRPHCQIWNVPVQVAAACSGVNDGCLPAMDLSRSSGDAQEDACSRANDGCLPTMDLSRSLGDAQEAAACSRVNDGCLPVMDLSRSCGDAQEAAACSRGNDGCLPAMDLSRSCSDAQEAAAACSRGNDGCPPAMELSRSCSDGQEAAACSRGNDGCPPAMELSRSCGDAQEAAACSRGNDGCLPAMDLSRSCGDAQEAAACSRVNDGCLLAMDLSRSFGDVQEAVARSRVNDGFLLPDDTYFDDWRLWDY